MFGLARTSHAYLVAQTLSVRARLVGGSYKYSGCKRKRAVVEIKRIGREVKKMDIAIAGCAFCIVMLFLVVNKLCKRVEVLEKKLGINKPEKKDSANNMK